MTPPRQRWLMSWALPVAAIVLGVGAWSVWTAAAETTSAKKNTILTEAETERIRRTLEQLSANQEQILAACEELEAELSIVKVRVTR